MKLNSEHSFELATLEINAIWRMGYFFWYCLNTTVSEFNNFNTSNFSSKEICLAVQNGPTN